MSVLEGDRALSHLRNGGAGTRTESVAFSGSCLMNSTMSFTHYGRVKRGFRRSLLELDRKERVSREKNSVGDSG